MNPSKGNRSRIHLRLPDALLEQLETERDARHEAGTLRRVDGIPALIEEAVALRHDRDAEMDRIRKESSAARSREEALVKELREQRRTVKVLRAEVRGLKARRVVRAQASLPAAPTPVDAFLRDHAQGLHEDGRLGVQLGACPACGPVALARAG